jgi:hypothetical protein
MLRQQRRRINEANNINVDMITADITDADSRDASTDMRLRTARRSGVDFQPITTNSNNDYIESGFMNQSAIIRAGEVNTSPWNDHPAFPPFPLPECVIRNLG